jgi:hypothetical protein
VRFSRRPSHPRPPLGVPAERDGCWTIRPPVEDEAVFIGLCEGLGLWRIKADPVDLHGVIEPDTGLAGFYESLADAADRLDPVRPDVAQTLRDLLSPHDPRWAE